MVRIKSKKLLNVSENGNPMLFRHNSYNNRHYYPINNFDKNYSIKKSEKQFSEGGSDVFGRNSTIIIIDPKIRTLLIFATIVAILYKIFRLSMPETTAERFNDVQKYVFQRIEETWTWINHEENQSNIIPIICGVVFSLFSWAFVYLDSNVVGMDPPSPFSPKSKARYRRQKKSSLHLGYITAIVSGILVTFLMFYKF